ncbi:MAG: DUF6293 family protein [Methanocellales archaeon]|nr:DUF6293 family protein [Methanocellales archaeon]MDD3291094.1 DUF6293 family protein [Methanocellales archaeon]MDD5234979.1 DUF6293 family protein [Methanocellales archaeon]MDD5484650.1 DUF6293 family protein [Methanocellales archaeon]
MLQRITHVVPIGFEEDRAVYGFINLSANRIYLLIDEKEGAWGIEARKHADAVKERLNKMAFDKNNIISVFFDPTEFESSKNAVLDILEKEKDASKVYLNISTSTKLCAVAFTLAAIDYDNALLYYVVPEKYNLPSGGSPFSSGATRVEVFSPKVDIKFSEWEKEILNALAVNKVSSLGELNKILVPDDMSKAVCAKLSYYVRKLQEKRYVDFKKGKSIILTERGRGLVKPIKDDAEVISG